MGLVPSMEKFRFLAIGFIETLSDFIEDYRTKHEISTN